MRNVYRWGSLRPLTSCSQSTARAPHNAKVCIGWPSWRRGGGRAARVLIKYELVLWAGRKARGRVARQQGWRDSKLAVLTRENSEIRGEPFVKYKLFSQ